MSGKSAFEGLAVSDQRSAISGQRSAISSQRSAISGKTFRNPKSLVKRKVKIPKNGIWE